MDKHTDLISRLQDEADLCRNDGATDIAALLDEAVEALRDRNHDTAVGEKWRTDSRLELAGLRDKIGMAYGYLWCVNNEPCAPDYMPPERMAGAELDTLIALVEHGPLWDGDLPSKTGRDTLIERGLAVRVVVKGEDGWQAATYAGRDAYKAHFSGPDGPADTIKEAKVNRLTRRAISSAARTA